MKFLTHVSLPSGLKKTLKRGAFYALALAFLVIAGLITFKAAERFILVHQEEAAELVAQELLQALMLNDAAQVATLMASLESQQGIQMAELVTREGVSLASFARPGQLADPHQPFALASLDEVHGQVLTTIPMTFDGMVVANLHVLISVWPAYQKAMAGVGLGVLLLGALYAWLKRLGLKIRWEPPTHRVSDGGGFDVQEALRLALAQAEITLKFQPVRRMSDGGVFGMEVYVCWPQSDGQLLHLSPADFVEEAHKAGMCLPFDAWVFETACAQAAQWQREHGPLILAFNISQSQFEDPRFANAVRQICDMVHFPYQLLEFEVNERVLTRDLTQALGHAHSFVDQGLSLTVDGFGLNQTFADQFPKFNITKVKFDRQLVQRSVRDAAVARLMSHAAGLANANDVLIMAEGVDSKTQCDVLQRMGVILGQGDHFSPPLDADEFAAFLKQPSMTEAASQGAGATGRARHPHTFSAAT